MERAGGIPLVNHLLQHTLRRLCADGQWVYSVLWRILPRNYPPPKWDTDAGPFDRSKGNKRNWILVWEDGYCDFGACCRDAMKENQQATQEVGEEDSSCSALQPELFFKMSHDVYNYGEGLIGKVASDNSHKWIFRDRCENENTAFVSPWQGTLDSHPRTWDAQFKAGIQTIAVVAVGEGLLQLGSTRKIVEDLNFVISLQRKFNYLQSIPGVFAPHPMPDMLGARSSPTNQMKGNFAGEELCKSNDQQMLDFMDNTTYRNAGVGIRMPLFAQENQLVGMKRPLDSDNGVLNNLQSCHKLPSVFAGIQANSSLPSEISPRWKNSSSLDKSRFNSESSPLDHSTAQASVLLPSMSSLQALLSKLPAVKAPCNTHSTGLLNYSMNPSTLHSYTDASAMAAKPRPPKTTGVSASSTPMKASPLPVVAMYPASCNTTSGTGNCTMDVRRRVGAVPCARLSTDWADALLVTEGRKDSLHPGDAPQETANFSAHVTEFGASDEFEDGDPAYNSMFGEVTS